MRIAPEAEADMADARDWYDQQRNGLGAEFLLCVEEVLDRVSRNPGACAVAHRDVRRALPRRFPYAVYYRIVEGEVMIVAVLHAARSPRVWRSRT